jgi:rhodanese-related sulfurtransferase
MFNKSCTTVAMLLSVSIVGCSEDRSDVAYSRSYDDSSTVRRTVAYDDRAAQRPVRTVSPQKAVPISDDDYARPGSPVRAAGYEGDGSRRVQVPRGPQHKVTLDEIRMHVKEGTAVFVDARSAPSFAEGHVRGAINIPAGQMEHYRELGLVADRDQLIIIYCTDESCESSDMVYEYLLGEGFTNMRVYRPGWASLSTAAGLR